MSEWQPTETAEGVGEFLLYVPHDKMRPPGRYTIQFGFRSAVTGKWKMIDEDNGGLVECEPTHWMPTIKPPELYAFSEEKGWR